MENNWVLIAKCLADPSFKICPVDESEGYYHHNGAWLNYLGNGVYPDFHLTEWQEYTEPKKPRKTRVEKRYVGILNIGRRTIPSYDSVGKLFENHPNIKGYTETEVHIFDDEG